MQRKNIKEFKNSASGQSGSYQDENRNGQKTTQDWMNMIRRSLMLDEEVKENKSKISFKSKLNEIHEFPIYSDSKVGIEGLYSELIKTPEKIDNDDETTQSQLDDGIKRCIVDLQDCEAYQPQQKNPQQQQALQDLWFNKSAPCKKTQPQISFGGNMQYYSHRKYI